MIAHAKVLDPVQSLENTSPKTLEKFATDAALVSFEIFGPANLLFVGVEVEKPSAVTFGRSSAISIRRSCTWLQDILDAREDDRKQI
jgi:hypothetical protein